MHADIALSPESLEAALRAVGPERYHDRHPFHRLLHTGQCSREQVQAWALNRFAYQAAIPVKDAILMARLPTSDLRREWRRRIADHDGDAPGTGGVARWLRLAEGVGLDPIAVERQTGVLPATRFAVDAYVGFVRDRPILEAIASSLTEMFAHSVISERVSGMLAGYPWITSDTLAYFTPRLTQAPRDVDFALGYVREHARTRTAQDAVMDALRFKCDVLWAMLDALHHAYVTPGLPPPGAFSAAEP